MKISKVTQIGARHDRGERKEGAGRRKDRRKWSRLGQTGQNSDSHSANVRVFFPTCCERVEVVSFSASKSWDSAMVTRNRGAGVERERKERKRQSLNQADK